MLPITKSQRKNKSALWFAVLCNVNHYDGAHRANLELRGIIPTMRRVFLALALIVSTTSHAQQAYNPWRVGIDLGYGATSGRRHTGDCDESELRGVRIAGLQAIRMVSRKVGIFARAEWMAATYSECFFPEGVSTGFANLANPRQFTDYLYMPLGIRYATPTRWVRAYIEASAGPAFLLDADGTFYRYESGRAQFFHGDQRDAFESVRTRYAIGAGTDVFGLTFALRYSGFLGNAFRDDARPYDWTGTRFGALTAHLGFSIGFGERREDRGPKREYLHVSRRGYGQ